MGIRDDLVRIGAVIALAEFIAFLISLIPYFALLQSIKDDPDPSKLIGFAKWLQWFLYGQVVGWPISLISNFLFSLRRNRYGD